MKNAHRISAVLVITSVVCLAAAIPAEAGLIHAGVWVSGSAITTDNQGIYDRADYSGSRMGGNAAAIADRGDVELTDDDGLLYAASAASAASIDLSPGGGMHLSASTRTVSPIYSTAGAAAEWVDVIRVGSGVSAPPSSLLLTFHVQGTISLSTSIRTRLSDASTRFDLDTSQYYGPMFGNSGFPGPTSTSDALSAQRITQWIYDDGPAHIGFVDSLIYPENRLLNFRTSVSSDPGSSFSFSFSYDVQSTSNRGDSGYSLDVFARLETMSAFSAGSDADLSHTIRLSSVTLPNGQALSEPITFDSGFQLTSVPEPSSVVTLSAAAVCLVMHGLRRQRAARS